MKQNLTTGFSARQYMLSRDFEIYYYSDKNLRRVENHTHDYFEFYFFLEGDVEMQIRTEAHRLQTGDLIVIPPKTPHHVRVRSTDAPYRRFVFWVSRDYLGELIALSPDYGYLTDLVKKTHTHVFHFDDFSFAGISAKVFELLEESHTDRFGKSARLSVLTQNLLLHLCRAVYEQKNAAAPDDMGDLYHRLVLYIENHIDEDLSLDHLAEVFFVSKYHIAHLFKDKTGYSTHQYIMKKRLEICRNAILNGESITETCARLGFNDYSVFYRAFTKEYGISPKRYRAEKFGLTLVNV